MGRMSLSWEDLESLITKNYGMKIVEYENIKKIIKCKTDQGIKALKMVDDSFGRFLFICEAMEHTRRNGFHNIPEICKTVDGQWGIEAGSGILMMTDWMEAREADYESKKDLYLTATALASFHQISKGFHASKESSPRFLWGQWLEHFHHRAQEILLFKEKAENKKEKKLFDQHVIHYANYFHDWAIKSIRHLEESSYIKISEMGKLEKAYCHHDMANHNVLISEHDEVFLIDFDHCIYDITIHDAASLIIRNVRYGNWSLDKAYYIFDTYNQTNRILGEEIGIIRAMMEFPQEFWQVGLQYYVEQQPWEEEVFERRLIRILEDIPKREVFMKRFLV
ncbi:MAG: CotS family spore coat protein [Bacillota bacterium]